MCRNIKDQRSNFKMMKFLNKIQKYSERNFINVDISNSLS